MTQQDPFFLPSDPDRLVGEVFRRLSSIRALGEPAMQRAVRAALVALGRAAHEEAEHLGRLMAERPLHHPKDARRVSATARRIDADGWDPGEPEQR